MNSVKSLSEKNLTIPPNVFSMDSVPTKVSPRFFDGNDRVLRLPKICFVNPNTGEETYERSALISSFAFNGTAMLTPSAFDKTCGDLNMDTVPRSKLQGELLVLDLEQGVQYGRKEMETLLKKIGIETDSERSIEDCIVLCRTKLMKDVLEITDDKGNPDYDQLPKSQKNRPGFLPEGAEFLHKIVKPKVIMIDGISFEPPGVSGFSATQALANINKETGDFTPLVYHVGNTDNPNFTEEWNGQNVQIEAGNIPQERLTGHPVAVYLEKK